MPHLPMVNEFHYRAYIKSKYGVTEPQTKFHLSPARYTLFLGAPRAGKTRALIEKGIDLSVRYPRNIGMLARWTDDSLRTTLIPEFFEYCPGELILDFKDDIVYLRTIATHDRPDYHSVIFLRSLKSSQIQTKFSKIKGLNLGWFAIDQAEEMEYEFFPQLQTRLSLPQKENKGMFSANPPNRGHWLFKVFGGNLNPDYLVVHADIYSNPSLADSYIKSLEKDYAHSQPLKDRFLLGKWGGDIVGHPKFTGIFQELHKRHLTYYADEELYRVWDFGFRHPAVVWFQFVAGKMLVLLEDLGQNTFLEYYAPKIIEKTNKEFPRVKSIIDICDASGLQASTQPKKSYIDILGEFDIEPFYQKQLVDYGLELLSRQMSKLVSDTPGFLIDSEKCPILTEGFETGYTVDEKGNPINDDYYIHLIDCVRYGIFHITESRSMNVPNFEIGQPKWSFNRGITKNF